MGKARHRPLEEMRNRWASDLVTYECSAAFVDNRLVDPGVLAKMRVAVNALTEQLRKEYQKSK